MSGWEISPGATVATVGLHSREIPADRVSIFVSPDIENGDDDQRHLAGMSIGVVLSEKLVESGLVETVEPATISEWREGEDERRTSGLEVVTSVANVEDVVALVKSGGSEPRLFDWWITDDNQAFVESLGVAVANAQADAKKAVAAMGCGLGGIRQMSYANDATGKRLRLPAPMGQEPPLIGVNTRAEVLWDAVADLSGS